jgi:hypothetical protein
MELRNAIVISAQRQIRPRTVKASDRKIARLDMTCDYFHGLNEIRMARASMPFKFRAEQDDSALASLLTCQAGQVASLGAPLNGV